MKPRGNGKRFEQDKALEKLERIMIDPEQQALQYAAWIVSDQIHAFSA